ncbi:hypothetical protein KLER11_gp82 [Pararheinheimera phage vB_PsoM_KLER1-1]|nr:hypothetical protein KLER11_gp82 [Pararheinheimera phage vB_PsoM_KLER1-1]
MTNQTKHTPEPWTADGNYIRSNEGDVIAACEGDITPFVIDEANARRIVACVNACDGISTDNLEQNKPIKDGLHGLNERIRVAEMQRDQLLVALGQALSIIAEDRNSLFESCQNPNTKLVTDEFDLAALSEYDEVITLSNAAIATAKGGAV